MNIELHDGYVNGKTKSMPISDLVGQYIENGFHMIEAPQDSLFLKVLWNLPDPINHFDAISIDTWVEIYAEIKKQLATND